MAETTITRYLIAGAGGSHGATGNHAARQLLARGASVRAFVHHADERSDRLAELGAEILVGDLHDFQKVRAALDGVQRAYFTYPLADGVLQASTIFAVAGAQAGLQSVVNMSQITAGPDHASPAARQHWLAERVLDWSGIGTTHLRPPFFLETSSTSPPRPCAPRARSTSRTVTAAMPPSAVKTSAASRGVSRVVAFQDIAAVRHFDLPALKA